MHVEPARRGRRACRRGRGGASLRSGRPTRAGCRAASQTSRDAPSTTTLPAELGRRRGGLLGVALAAAGAGGSALADGVDQRAARAAVVDRVGRQVELQQAHRALDVDADRARDRCASARPARSRPARRSRSGASGLSTRSVTPGASARVDRLLEAQFVERAADRLGADDGDRLACLPPVGRMAVASPVGMSSCMVVLSRLEAKSLSSQQGLMKHALYRTELRPR